MDMLKCAEIAEKWGVSERSVRNYCAEGRIAGAMLIGKTWHIPADAAKPGRRDLKQPHTLLEILRDEMRSNRKGGIYHKVQIELTYNSNHMEGSKLTHDQTRYIFETNTIGLEKKVVNVDDIVETVNHFRCIDYVITNARQSLNEAFIKELHKILKTGTADSRKEWFAVGSYKRLPNEVGGKVTASPDEVSDRMKQLLAKYTALDTVTLDDIIAFHCDFEAIHPFQDGNGRVGRLIMLKECLKNGIVPFIIKDEMKLFYYRGLQNWQQERGWLTDTILTAQDQFKAYLDYFRIPY